MYQGLKHVVIGESKCSHHRAPANGMLHQPGSKSTDLCGYILRTVGEPCLPAQLSLEDPSDPLEFCSF